MADKKVMLKALAKTRGIVSTAAEAANISRQTHYDWIKDDPEYKAAVDAINEATIDFVESKLMQLIDGPTREVITEHGITQLKDPPVTAAAIFYLKTKGKSRGYVERQEITGAEGGPVQIIAPDNI
jgi:hypothetical protein